ncbi:MAG: geranylgeranylglycerol-phosphate geranylgeranyltransferase [Cyclobacteriaceae bacterium]|jgi:4-hydroxybenzoate polyprenyltransferase|nr:geranylgeranylglycerol-phosphate geranylgeranyltransferase [Cyclobacteriaceae bacterium]
MASFFSAMLRLTRFGNLLIIGFAQTATAFFLVGSHTWQTFSLWLLSSSTIIIAAAGYIINDYYDIKIDYINKPERVVIGKIIPRRFAILFHTLFSVSGIAIGFYLSWQIGVIHFFSAFMLWLYSNSLKRLPLIGNVVIAFLTSLSVFIIAVYYKTNFNLILIYALFAFFISLVREVVKDMEDLKGDITFGCKTLPILWGIRKTKFFLYTVLVVFVLIVLVLDSYFTILPSVYFMSFLFLPLAWFALRLHRADTVKDFRWLSNLSKIIMLLGIISMLFLPAQV